MTGLPGSVGTIGAGNMAEAILRGLLRAGVSPASLRAADPDASRRERIEAARSAHDREQSRARCRAPSWSCSR